MSSQSIVNWTGNQKIYDSLLPNPYPYPAFPSTLAQTLLAGDDAGNQDIENLRQMNTSIITQQDALLGSSLSIGGLPLTPLVGGDLKIQGATTKGSILVGNGTSTKELVVGANGLVLTTNSTAPYGVEWAVGGGGGGVASVTAGTNVSVTGTATNPIVGVSSPLTSTLNMGTQSLTDSASSTGLASQYLTAGTGGQTLWATLPTSVASVSAGTNISLSGTASNPIVNLQAPLTSTLNVGSQTISSSTGAITIQPVAGQDINALVDGAGRLHITQSGTGGATQPAISVENNNGNANAVEIDYYKNSASPAAADELGIVSFHGNSSTGVKTEYASIKATIADPTNASQNGSLALSCCVNSATPSAFLTCDGTLGYIQTNKSINTLGNNITTTTGAVNLYQQTASQNIGLTNVASGGSIIINKSNTGGGNVSILSASEVSVSGSTNIALTSTSGAVVITQPNSGTTKLTTNIANKNFYPESVITNGNSNSASVDANTIQGERLVLENRGVTPLNTWIDNGSSFGSGISASFYDATNNLLWVAFGTTLQVLAPDYSTTFATNSVAGTSSGFNTTPIRCLYAYGQYIYVGGDFVSVNGNAQSQYGITRFFRTTWNEDPIYDSGTGCSGVNGYVNCICGDPYNPNDSIFCGGLFASVNGSGTSVGNLIRVDGVSAAGGGMNVYTNWCNELSTDGEVRCGIEYNGKNFFGGNFTLTSVLTGSPISINFFGSYYTSLSWTICDGNSFNGACNSCSNSVSGNVLVGGSFNHTSPAYLCYIDSSTPSNPYIAVNISPNSFNSLNSVTNYNSGWDTIIDSGGNVWIESSLNNWVSKGQAVTGGSDGAVQFWTYDNNVRAIFSNYSYHRIPVTNPQNCVFTLTSGNFKSNGTLYTSYTITIPDQAAYFIGDGAGIWRPLGYNPYQTFS